MREGSAVGTPRGNGQPQGDTAESHAAGGAVPGASPTTAGS